MLIEWYTGSFIEIARRKRYAMGVDGFNELLNEFPQALDCVKPLCIKIRGMLFPYENGLLVGTPSGTPEKLYNSIIEIFDDAIANMATG